MSLMNDALRKKKREDSGVEPTAGVFAPSPARQKTKKQPIVLAVIVVLCCIILGSIALRRAKNSNAINVSQPLPAQSDKSAGITTDPSAINVPSERTPPLTAKVPPSHSESLTATVETRPSVPLFKPFASDLSRSRQPAPLPATMAAEKTIRLGTRNVLNEKDPSPLEGDRRTSVETSPQPSRAFEPGPSSVPSSQPSIAPRAKLSVTPVSEAKPNFVKPIGAVKKTKDHKISDTDLFYRKALACHRSGRLTEAARFYRSALETDANHRQAMFNLAAVYIESGHFDQALPLLKRLEKVKQRPNGVLLNLAIASLGNHAPDAALNYLDLAETAADAPVWQIQFHRAVILVHLNRLSEALVLYKQVETMRPDDYRVKYNLAVTCDIMGDYPQAFNYYEALLKETNPASQEDRPSIIKRLKLLRRYLNTTRSQAKRQ